MNKLKWGLIFVGALTVAGILYEGWRELRELFLKVPPSMSDRLKEDEREKIIIDSNGDVKRIKRGKDGKTQTEKIDTGSEKVELIIKDDGTVLYQTKTFGLLLEPGFNIGIDLGADSNQFFLGPDIRFAYYKNFGLISGLSTDGGLKHFCGHLDLGYRLPFAHFRNTSVYVGYNTRKSIQTGLRVKF